MRVDPCHEIGEAIGRAHLELERLGILLLPARALEINDKLARDRERELRAMVFLDQREREIDAGRDAARGVEPTVLDEERIAVDAQRRKARGERIGVAPVRRDLAAVEETRRRDAVDARADSRDATDATGMAYDPRSHLRIRRGLAKAASARHDQRVERRRVAERRV